MGSEVHVVLFDIGDTLLHSAESDEALVEFHKAALRGNGVDVSDAEFEAALEHCLLSFAPSLTRAVNWYLVKPDVALCNAITDQVREMLYAWADDHPLPARPGTGALLASLAQAVRLALAGNARTAIRETLAGYGLLQYFQYTEVSDDIGFEKPDLRFFEHILQRCGATGPEAIMVGDRLDYDVIPAKKLGMRTVWFRTGPQSRLVPRTPRELPDAEVTSMAELGHALSALIGRPLPRTTAD